MLSLSHSFALPPGLAARRRAAAAPVRPLGSGRDQGKSKRRASPEHGWATPRRRTRTRTCPAPRGERVTGVTLRLDRMVDLPAETVEGMGAGKPGK